MTGIAGLMALLSMAWAGGGPWVISPGDASIYTGTSVERFSHLAVSNGKYADDVITVDNGVTKFGLQALVTYGLLPQAEIELTVPWQYNRANRTDGTLCASFGDQTCNTTVGFAPIRGRLKVQVLDEFYGAPLSFAVGMGLRQGQYTAPERDRITNIGEGTADLEAFVSAGRSGLLGDAFWSAYVDATWRYRFPNTYNDDLIPVPGWELLVDAEMLAGGPPQFSFGPAVSLFWRPWGIDFEDIDLSDPDRFAGLQAHAVRIGAKAILRSSDRVLLAMSTMWTVAAKNNPSDSFVLGVGVQIFQVSPFRIRESR
jgi:hypothetical protein